MTDRLRRHNVVAALGCLLVVLGFLLPASGWIRASLIGVGNSLFHVGGGTVTLRHSGGSAKPLGIFVSPGSVGLALGTMFPRGTGYFMLAGLALSGVLMLVMRYDAGEDCETAKPELPLKPVFLASLMLLIAVTVRSYGGFAVHFEWKTGVFMPLLAVFAVFLGKFAGGFLCDRLGETRLAAVSLPLAAVLTAFFPQIAPLGILGQFLLNLTMPVTLLLLYKLMPDSPGFSFGMAASVLWPGALLAYGLPLSGSALSACILASFLAGLLAIFTAEKTLKNGGKLK